MLLDNKTHIAENEHYKVHEFMKANTEQGSLDIVTGFFSINALAFLKNEVNAVEKFRLILGELMKEEAEEDKIINLLNGNLGIKSVLELSASSQAAIEFLQQEKVLVKSIQKNFCHAKAYLYTDKTKTKNYFIVGSSNLTDAGLGIRESANIELNIAKHDYEDEFKNLKKWFQEKWDKVATEKLRLPNKSEISVKEYIINLIRDLCRKYTPQDLYYKTLYEMFKNDILEFSADEEFQREIAHLEETIIYKSLFPYQQKGVMSLIKMLQKYNGAILADAVGLGKTWTALAVMKYFELQGYTVLLLCPKKLSNNWEQYKAGHQSRFEKDEIEFYIRYHTDLQEERFDRYTDKKLRYFQTRQKLLIVIDESHNLRNDKSARYKFLIEKILYPENKSRDVKVLHLSATPINNKLTDVRNQIKLITKGQDDGFKETDLEVDSLETIFRVAQRDFAEWSAHENRTIADFIAILPRKFEKLADALIVSRTRKLIEGEFGELNFPKKAPPINEFIAPKNIGNLKTFDDILNAIAINLTAYRPADYIKQAPPKSVLEDEQQRQKFLVKMMYILLVKRLESSWFSFKLTVENILNHHIHALEKVGQFLNKKQHIEIEVDLSEEETEELEETAAELNRETDQPLTLGKKKPIPLSAITSIETFKDHLERDIKKLSELRQNLDTYYEQFKAGEAKDEKLEKLIAHIKNKQKNSTNKKVLIFTVYKDTAKFLYDELKKRGIKNLAFVSGSVSESDDGYSGEKFEPILERFAPYTKLYIEKDWSELYAEHLGQHSPYYQHGKWQVPFDTWKELIKQSDTHTFQKLCKPIDVLIATDCLSEGQNLQDCDCVINYDIHWNPVRLIQRMGRIDRLGSPNQTITGINFWPSKDYEEYLNLKSRVEKRMALMTIVGTEVNQDLTPELQEMIKDNPLLPKQAQKMLEQMQLTWDDIETNDETLGFNDLSLEQFRQELIEFFRRNEEFFKRMPNGIYTGFKCLAHEKWKNIESSLIAVLGYPRRPDGAIDHTYQEIHLAHQPTVPNANALTLKNHQDILNLLRFHKFQPRYVPNDVENAHAETLETLAHALHTWIQAQAQPVAIHQIQDLFFGHTSPTSFTLQEQKVEEKFTPENFDLICWFILTNET
jgi:superfamily II DNA or RNA helicase